MAKLTRTQLKFLKDYLVPIGKTFDATGLRKSQYQDSMSANGLWIAYGVTPCRAGGHTLRLRTGHCVQCRPATLSYLKRHECDGELYVASSSVARLVKVGIGESAEHRIGLLRKERYAGTSDWKLEFMHSISANGSRNPGAIEARIHSRLKDYAMPAKYLKEGKVVQSRETFAVDVDHAVYIARQVLNE